MAEPHQLHQRRAIQLGPDKVTINGEEVLIETRRPMPDWDVRELNPIPIYFEHRKYLLVHKRKGRPPFAMGYLLKPWPEAYVSSSTRFQTYDHEAIAERETTWRRAQNAELIRLALLPLSPFLGLFWSGIQEQLIRFGFIPRQLTRLSIFTVLLCIIPASFLVILLSGGSPLLCAIGFIFIMAGGLDAVKRTHFYMRDGDWAGGFLEWLTLAVSASPRPMEVFSPGFWATLEILIWNPSGNATAPRPAKKRPLLQLPPIIERELRVALRKQQPVRRRWRIAVGCTAAALVLSLVIGPSAGRTLHQFLCLVVFYIVLRVPQRIAGLFSAERRDQTLGLLFISGLTATEVFLSKTISAAAIVFSDLLAIVPFLALPFLMGGVSFELFVATAFCLPNLLLLALAISLLASILADDEGTVVILTAAFAIAIVAVPPVIYGAQRLFSNGNAHWTWLPLLSPAYTPWLVFKRFTGIQSLAFWRNSSITFAWSVVCLSAAAFALARLWREHENHKYTGWLERCRAFVRGSPLWRRNLAATWLDTNPFTWLAARDRRAAVLAWPVVGGIISAWLIGFALWPSKWPSAANFFITATVLNLSLRWLLHYNAAASLGLSRRDGSYELLLTTPLLPVDIVRGQLHSLHCQFRNVGVVVLAFELIMMLLGLTLRDWNANSLLVYFVLWGGLLFWTWDQGWNSRGTVLSMWAGLNSARPAKAVWRVLGLNSWVWVWIFFSLRHGISGFRTFPSGSGGELVLAFLGVCVFVSLFQRARSTARVMEQRLTAEFREIVREPLPDPNDPRFKQWNVRERFPWGWEIVQGQLHERIARREIA